MNKKIHRILLILFLMLFPVSAYAVEDAAAVSIPVCVRVTGEEPHPQTEYRFLLTPAESAYVESPCEAVRTGEGELSFSAIFFPTVGVYRYTLSQIPGNEPGIRYDDRVYDVTVTVFRSEAEPGYDVSVSVSADGRKYDEAEFVNIMESGKKDTLPVTPLIQTGLLRWPLWALGWMGVLLCVLGAAGLIRRRKK